MGVNIENGAEVVNATVGLMSANMRASIPMATEDNIAEVGKPILQWTDVANAFYSTLINLIGMTYVEYRQWKNPLSMFKRGDSILGSDVREIAINLAVEKDYDLSGNRLLTNEAPDLKVAYYRLNRQKDFEVTNIEAELQLAFSSWDNFGTLVSRIVDNLYRSNEVAEYEWTKATINTAINDSKIPVTNIALPVDSATANAFAKTVKTLSDKFTFFSTAYNAYNLMNTTDEKPFKTFTPKEQQVLLITPEALSSLDVDSLATAFNMSKVEFMGRTVVLDDFGTGADGETPLTAFAMLCDSAFIKIWDKTRYFNTFVNPANMSAKHFFHVWQTYGYSPFANAVLFKPQA